MPPQPAATDSDKAIARETAALLKPLMDDIDHKLDQVLEAIAAIPARLDGHLTQGGKQGTVTSPPTWADLSAAYDSNYIKDNI